MGAAAFTIYVANIHNISSLEWLTVPLTFLFTNLFEWAVHKYVMHQANPDYDMNERRYLYRLMLKGEVPM